ncbi:cation transporter [Vibrio aestuarianus]|uniref:cation diffusion facilitator family transporter n=1 Tax=Vibrio aestuarianus TaxID=28171 RepID=UPI00237C9D3F|nr:cation transporter [Vibrio aestuarianus]MDE1326915.1 cation transporter [Vibrio aestuarianus]
MENDSHNNELKILKFSICMGVIYTVVGISWGIAIQSGIILFDAIYSGVSIILSVMSLYALNLVNNDEQHHLKVKKSSFQMGRTAIEPLVITVKSIVIIVICLYGMANAISTIIGGVEEPMNAIAGMGYGVVTSVICLSSWLYIKAKGQDMPDLVQAESEQWLVDTAFSVLVIVSFVISYVLKQTSWGHLSGYIDPMAVIITSLYFIQVPGKRLAQSIKELLLMAPDDRIQDQLTGTANDIARRYQLGTPVVRSTKIGRQLAIDITFILENKNNDFTINDFDNFRSEIESNLNQLGFDLWLNISFTYNSQWA